MESVIFLYNSLASVVHRDRMAYGTHVDYVDGTMPAVLECAKSTQRINLRSMHRHRSAEYGNGSHESTFL